MTITIDHRIDPDTVRSIIAAVQDCPFCDRGRLQLRAHSITDPPYVACLDCGATGPKGVLEEPRQFTVFGMEAEQRMNLRQYHFDNAVRHCILLWNERRGPL